MSKEELREYVISHQDDREAFHQYVDLLQSHPSPKVYPSSLSPDEIQQVIFAHVQQKQNEVNF
jgi:hypothetical protein